MRKTKICIWTGTRRRSTSRLSRVVGLVGVSGYAYWIGLPAAPLMGLRRVALKYKRVHVLQSEKKSYHVPGMCHCASCPCVTHHQLFLYVSCTLVKSNSHSTNSLESFQLVGMALTRSLWVWPAYLETCPLKHHLQAPREPGKEGRTC